MSMARKLRREKELEGSLGIEAGLSSHPVERMEQRIAIAIAEAGKSGVPIEFLTDRLIRYAAQCGLESQLTVDDFAAEATKTYQEQMADKLAGKGVWGGPKREPK